MEATTGLDELPRFDSLNSLNDNYLNKGGCFKDQNAQLEDFKKHWINVVCYNAELWIRPKLSTLISTKPTVINFGEKQSKGIKDYFNNYFINHLLIIHEKFCNECYKGAEFYGNYTKSDNQEHTLKEGEPSENEIGTEISPNNITYSLESELNTPIDYGNISIITETVTSKCEVQTENDQLRQIIRTRRSLRPTRNLKIKYIDNESDETVQISKSKNISEKRTNKSPLKKYKMPQHKIRKRTRSTKSITNSTEDSKIESTTSKKTENKCPLCNHLFSRPGKLKTHIETHHRGKRYPCEICNKEYMLASTLKSHMLEHNEGPVECEKCGKKLKSSVSLKHHMKIHQPRKFVSACETCGKLFQSKWSLKAHEAVHSEKKDFVCETCGKSFKSNASLIVHNYSHTGGKSYSCDICGATFRHSVLRFRHKKQEHGTQDQLCAQCGKAFYTITQLKQHILTHSLEPHFKCTICSKGYRSKTGLESHMNLHKGIIPNVCQYCGKRFLSQPNMFKHIARHKGIKKHNCEICPKGFITKQELTVHLKVHMEITNSGCIQQTK